MSHDRGCFKCNEDKPIYRARHGLCGYTDCPYKSREADVSSAAMEVKRANARQVGGEHYKTGGTEHWDLFGPEYHMACATKYVSRWRKKNGVQDLEKAKHYVEKLMEIVSNAKREDFKDFLGHVASPETTEAWARNLGLDYVETVVVNRIMYWRDRSDLVEAQRGIEYLIASAPQLSAQQEISRLAASMKREAYDPNRADGYAQKDGKTVLLRERRDGDEAVHASLYPWQIDVSVFAAMDQDRKDLLFEFYSQRGSNLHLDEFIEIEKIPHEIAHCYSYVYAARGFIIRLEHVPDELRELYPRLPLERNAVELDGLPAWQRTLYVWHDGKYRLTDRVIAAGWGKEH